MTPEQRERTILETLEARMAAMGVTTTAHYDACRGLIAAAIRAAVEEERGRIKTLVAAQPCYPGTNVGVRQQWVKAEILRKIGEEKTP